MSKAVLISIRSGWCQKIMEGRKTIEVRKTRPKMDTPFKCYIYKCGNGKVIGEFLCDQIININGAGRIPSDAARQTRLEPAELHQYLGAATGFGWHISDLRVYDHPRDLWEFKPHGFTIYCREDCEKRWVARWETWMVLPGVSEEEEEERKCLTNTSAARRRL